MERRHVRHRGWGFLLQAAASGVRAGYSLVVLPTLPVQSLLYKVLMVEPHEGRQEHLVIFACNPPLDQALCEQVRRVVSTRWPEAQTSFITDNIYESEGPTCRCAVYLGHDGQPAEVAAAVAESIRSGTLDDIDAVSVTVDGVSHSVALKWAGTHADATILEGAR